MRLPDSIFIDAMIAMVDTRYRVSAERISILSDPQHC
jgi:hypothetical protein